MSVRDVLAYPLRGEETPLGTFATGALLSALGPLVLPGILVAGYYGRVVASSAGGERRPPPFVQWRALFVQGLKTWTVVVVYAGLAVVLVVLLGLAAIVLGGLGTGLGSVVGLLAWAVAGLLVLAALFGPAWFLLPAVLTHVARTDDVRAAFDARTIARITRRNEYLVAWFAGATILLVGSLAYGIAGSPGALAETAGGSPASVLAVALGLVGHAAGAAVNFYCQVVAFHLFGRGYAAASAAAGEASADGEASVDGEPAERADEPRYTGWGAEAREWRERRREERERAGWEET